MLYFTSICIALNILLSVYISKVEAFGIKDKDDNNNFYGPIWKPTPYTPQIFNLFVYGKTKKNEINHYWMSNPENGLSKFIGVGQTVKKYPMVIGKYKTPILMENPGTGHKILGEIYVVDTFMLKNLDMLEGVPVFNVRKIEAVRIFTEEYPKGKEMFCWMYYAKVKPVTVPGLNYVSEYNSKNIPDY